MENQDVQADGGGSTPGWSGEGPDHGIAAVAPEADETGSFEYDPSVLAPSAAVVQAVATQTRRSGVEIDPLFSAVDPEALDAVFSRDGVYEVSFTYEGYRVTVDGDARISLRPADSA